VCTTIRTVYNSSSQPAAGICQGLQAISGGTCVIPNPNLFVGGCLATCNDLCQQVNQVVTSPCQ
jgi:hypothetical protein